MDFQPSLRKKNGYWHGVLIYRVDGKRKQLTHNLGIECDEDTPVKRNKKGHVLGKGGKSAEAALEKWAAEVEAKRAKAEADAELARIEREKAERAEAERLEREAEDARTGRNKTVSAALDEYIIDGTTPDSNGKTRIARSTADTYRHLRKRIDAALGDVRLRDLTASLVKAFEDEMNSEGVGASVIEKTHMLLSAVCKRNVILEVLDRNPCEGITHAHPTVRSIAASADEIARINAGLSARDPEGTDPFTVAVKVALGTGMRQGEICGLRWCDVTRGQNGCSIRLVRSIGREGGKTFKKTPKSEKPRFIPITDELARVLDKRRAYMREEARRAGFIFTDNHYVAGNADGSYMNPVMLGKTWRTFADVLRIVGTDKWGESERLTFHGLRHSFAVSYLRHNNWSDTAYNELKAILGHSSIYITLECYARPDTDAMREGINRAAASTEREDSGAEIIQGLFGRTGTDN